MYMYLPLKIQNEQLTFTRPIFMNSPPRSIDITANPSEGKSHRIIKKIKRKEHDK